MGMWDNIKSFVTGGNDEEETTSAPRTRAIQMMAMDNVGKGKLTTKDVYKQRHRMNKKRKKVLP